MEKKQFGTPNNAMNEKQKDFKPKDTDVLKSLSTQIKETIEFRPNAEVKTFKQTVTDEETGLPVKHLYYLRIVRGNVTVQINVGEKTYTQVKTLTEEEVKS